jgi:hypothetical protein
MYSTITQVTVQVSIPKDWIPADWENEIVLNVQGEVLAYDGKHTPIVKQITCNGYQMWLINVIHYFDVVALLDKHILDVYAEMKLNAADSNLSDYVE